VAEFENTDVASLETNVTQKELKVLHCLLLLSVPAAQLCPDRHVVGRQKKNLAAKNHNYLKNDKNVNDKEAGNSNSQKPQPSTL